MHTILFRDPAGDCATGRRGASGHTRRDFRNTAPLFLRRAPRGHNCPTDLILLARRGQSNEKGACPPVVSLAGLLLCRLFPPRRRRIERQITVIDLEA
jgi:hypothetical protein